MKMRKNLTRSYVLVFSDVELAVLDVLVEICLILWSNFEKATVYFCSLFKLSKFIRNGIPGSNKLSSSIIFENTNVS